MREIRTFELDHGEPAAAWRVAQPLTLKVMAGQIWLTVEGDLRDHWLHAGDTFGLPRGGVRGSARGRAVRCSRSYWRMAPLTCSCSLPRKRPGRRSGAGCRAGYRLSEGLRCGRGEASFTWPRGRSRQPRHDCPSYSPM